MWEIRKIFFWNALMGALVYLPVYLLSIQLQSMVMSEANVGSNWGILPGFGYLYISFIVPVEIGSLVHSLTLMFVPVGFSSGQRRAIAFWLSSLVPVTLLLIGWCCGNPAMVINWYIGTVFATVAYGYCSSTKFVLGFKS